ncbi:hypothetical protein HY571_02160 [Candidatus Micrarchaeota archaeon]|nr:hypothetical protein [Candidatus Micrarchaeota archaeon]
MVSNPYESKNYKYFLIAPALLVVIALGLIFFNGIQQGVDLKGGILLTFQTRDGVDVSALQREVEGVARVTGIRTFASPVGTGVEIELENDEELLGFQERTRELQRSLSELRELQLNATVSQEESEILRLGQEQTALSTVVLAGAKALLIDMGSEYNGADAGEAVQKVVRVFGEKQDEKRNAILAAAGSLVSIETYSFREVGPSLSKFFLEKSREILLFSFLLAAIAVFVVFRAVVPSLAVIIGAVVDIVATLGAMSLFGIPLTLASIAGLLMLIGFSLDTDVMLTMRVLKRKEGTPSQRAWGAFKTGAMMNLTTIGAFGILAIAGLYLQIPTYFEIGAVATIGGAIDFVATWGANAVLILMYAEKREAQ